MATMKNGRACGSSRPFYRSGAGPLERAPLRPDKLGPHPNGNLSGTAHKPHFVDIAAFIMRVPVESGAQDRSVFMGELHPVSKIKDLRMAAARLHRMADKASLPEAYEKLHSAALALEVGADDLEKLESCEAVFKLK